jgi:hypothetical protein
MYLCWLHDGVFSFYACSDPGFSFVTNVYVDGDILIRLRHVQTKASHIPMCKAVRAARLLVLFC